MNKIKELKVGMKASIIFVLLLIFGTGIAVAIELPMPVASQIVNDSTPELNIAMSNTLQKATALNIDTSSSAGSSITSDSTGAVNNNVRSIEVYPSNSIIGMIGLEEVNPWFNFGPPPSGISYTLYAPNFAAPNQNPLESVVGYIRWTKDMPTEKFWGVWDHTNPGFQFGKKLDDPKFLYNYVEWSFKPPKGYFIKTGIMKVGNEWQALLYNVKSKKWERQYGTTRIGGKELNGWNGFEYFLDGCPDVPEVESAKVMVFDTNGKNGPNWYPTDTTYAHIGYDWIVTGVNPCGYTGKMISKKPIINWWQTYQMVKTDKRIYEQTKQITFRITNQGYESIYIQSGSPLKIKDAKGNFVYDPNYCSGICALNAAVSRELKPGQSYSWTWDQKGNIGMNGQVPYGKYQGILIGDESVTSNPFDIVSPTLS